MRKFDYRKTSVFEHKCHLCMCDSDFQGNWQLADWFAEADRVESSFPFLKPVLSGTCFLIIDRRNLLILWLENNVELQGRLIAVASRRTDVVAHLFAMSTSDPNKRLDEIFHEYSCG